MYKIVQLAAMLFLVTSICAQSPTQTVNPIIGDESFVALFGFQPDEHTDNQLRVQAHLAYAEQKLRERPADGLTDQQKENREKVLDLLKEYWTNGIFPSNFDYPEERRPCFIDRNGNICAVGYLVEKTAGMELAQQINEKHQYDYLLDMNEPALEAWAEEHGFTLEECAMIQPAYQPPPQDPSQTLYQPVKTGYGVSSGLVGGLNLAVTTVNLTGRFGNSKGISYFGLLSGASQIIMGITNIKKENSGYWIDNDQRTVSYKAQNNLSYINIAMGTTTMVTSALNLYLNKKLKSNKNSVGLYSYPGLNNEMNLGVSLARRL
jgi:hypothetical protein